MRLFTLLSFLFLHPALSPLLEQTQMNLPVSSDESKVDYGSIGFGGAEQSSIVTDPTLATNKAGRVSKAILPSYVPAG